MNFLRLFSAKAAPVTPSTAGEQPRRITLSDRIVPYTIHRSQRRRLSLTVDHRGLRVLGPMSLTIRQAESMLLAHETWVLRKLDAWQTERLRRDWRISGNDPLLLLGENHAVSLVPHAARSICIEKSAALIRLHTRMPADDLINHRALVQWLRLEAMQCFEARVTHYASRLGVAMPPLSLSQARTRWGSCTSAGHIRLNWRLIHLPLPLIDYVVAHELAHLLEMNHSPRFWAVVESIYPNSQAARKTLRQQVSALPEIPTR